MLFLLPFSNSRGMQNLAYRHNERPMGRQASDGSLVLVPLLEHLALEQDLLPYKVIHIAAPDHLRSRYIRSAWQEIRLDRA